MKLFRVIVLSALLFGPVSALAQEQPRQLQLQLQFGRGASEGGGETAHNPALDSELKKQAYVPPKEPVFEKVTYLKIDPPGNLTERIDRLLHGIRVDIPPEYDHYGYEIRRYMAGVAGPQILGSPENIEAQIKNIANAKIVARYWREAMMAEIDEIEKQINAEDASSSTRTIFKFNRGIVQAFFIELESWLNVNRSGLEALIKIGSDRYTYKDPVLSFKDRDDLTYYASLHQTREKALKQIRKYTPFRMMIY